MRGVVFLGVAFKAACVLALAVAPGCSAVRRSLDPCGRLLPVPDPPGGEVLPMNFTPEGGGFRVGLPPTRPFRDGAEDGLRGKTYRWVILNRGLYEITYAESGGQLENAATSAEVLDRLKQSALSKGAGRLESERELRLGAHPGRELLIRDDDGVVIRRFYLAGGRIYIVSASVSSGIERCAMGDVFKILDSFELLESGGPASPSEGPE